MKMARDCGNCLYKLWEVMKDSCPCRGCESTFDVGSVPSHWVKAAHIKFKIVDGDDDSAMDTSDRNNIEDWSCDCKICVIRSECPYADVGGCQMPWIRTPYSSRK